MILSPRLAWRRWQLREQAVPHEGLASSACDVLGWRLIEQAWNDKAATGGVALDEEAAELLAIAANRGEVR